MKCFKCSQGELQPIKKDGKSYAQCDKCGSLFTADDLRNHTPQPQSTQTMKETITESKDDETESYGPGIIGTISGWILCALFLICGLGSGGISLLIFLVAAVLISPVFRNRVYLSGKIWIPLVIVLFITGMAMSPQTDTEPKKVAEKQETVTSTKKQIKASAKKQAKKDSEKEKAEKQEQERAAQEQAEREEQERLAQEQAAQAEQERIAQEQAAAQAEQERIAQEQAAAQQAEQERIAREQAAAQQAEQERIAREQAAAQQAEQERIALEQQAAQTSYVWLSATGDKYHSIPNCGRMNPDHARQVTLAEAQQMGIEACKNCH